MIAGRGLSGGSALGVWCKSPGHSGPQCPFGNAEYRAELQPPSVVDVTRCTTPFFSGMVASCWRMCPYGQAGPQEPDPSMLHAGRHAGDGPPGADRGFSRGGERGTRCLNPDLRPRPRGGTTQKFMAHAHRSNSRAQQWQQQAEKHHWPLLHDG